MTHVCWLFLLEDKHDTISQDICFHKTTGLVPKNFLDRKFFYKTEVTREEKNRVKISFEKKIIGLSWLQSRKKPVSGLQ